MTICKLLPVGESVTIPSAVTGFKASFSIDQQLSIYAIYFTVTDNTTGELVPWNSWGPGVITAGLGIGNNFVQGMTLANCYLMSTIYSQGNPYEISTSLNETSEASSLCVPAAPLSFGRTNKNFGDFSFGLNNSEDFKISIDQLTGDATNTRTMTMYALIGEELKAPKTNYMRYVSTTADVVGGNASKTIKISSTSNSRLNSIVFAQPAGSNLETPMVDITDNNGVTFTNAPSILARKAYISMGGNPISQPALVGNAYIWNFNAENTVSGGLTMDLSTSFTLTMSGLTGSTVNFTYANFVGR